MYDCVCWSREVGVGEGGREGGREGERDLLSPSFAEVVQWDIDDVCRWLEELGLGEHCEAFQERTIIGTKLLGLRKSDLQVSFYALVYRILKLCLTKLTEMIYILYYA